MAKLLSYYRLCPLIDLKSLLGVNEDKEKGVVIVTLGRNIAIRFRFFDQKQLSSWRTRDKFTCPVVFDKKQDKYVAVFNENIIKMWCQDDVALDQLKKFKFNCSLESLFIHNGEIHILFKNGSVYPLEDVLDSRKTFLPEKVIESSDEIQEFLHRSTKNELYIGYSVKKNEELTLYWTEYSRFRNNFNKVILCRKNLSVSGSVFHWEEGYMHFITIWTDNRLYSLPLKSPSKQTSEGGELVTAVKVISCSHTVRMTSLNENYLAVYGADCNEEGAVLFIYNTQFRVIQSKQSHKLYTDDSKLWQVESNLLLPVGQNLVVVPVRLESEQLAALVGSHKPAECRIDADISIVHEFETTSWQDVEKNKIHTKSIPKILETQIRELIRQGLPEALILDEIMPEIFEKKDTKMLNYALQYFTDIPEKYLVEMLTFLLSLDKNFFQDQTKYKSENFPKGLQPKGRTDLLDEVLSRSYSEELILPHLRVQLNISHVNLLLKYILLIFEEDGHNLAKTNTCITEEKLLNWCCLLIDANYQKIILSKDEEVEKVLVDCMNLVLKELESIEVLEAACPVLTRAVEEAKGNVFMRNGLENSRYSVEQISL